MTQAVKFSDFGGGMNNYTRQTMIQDKESPASINVWATGKNSLEKRPGFTLHCEVAGNKVSGLGTYYSSLARELLVMAGGKLYKDDTQIGVTTWTEDLATDFCQAAGKVFISNGVDVLRQYDGSTIADTTNGIIGKFSIFYKGCLWVAGNPSYPTRLYRSGTDDKIGDFTYNETGNPLATSVYIGKDDGQKITGMFKHQDYLYVMKENSIWNVFQGTDEFGIIGIELVDPSRGTVCHRTIDSVENDTFFFNDKGAYAFGYEPNIQTQIRTNIVSLRVDRDIKTIQKNRLDDVSGIYFDNKYYLSYSSGGSTYNDSILAYDRQRMGWWKLTAKANCFTEYKDLEGYSRLYYGSDVDGKVYYLDENAKSDDGVDIESSWKSAMWSFKDEFQSKFFLFVMFYFGDRPGDIIINIYIDNKLVSSKSRRIGKAGWGGIGTASIGTGAIGVEDGELTAGDTGAGDFLRIPVNKIGRSLQVEITDQSGTKGWELNGIEINLKPLNKIYQPGV